MNGGVSTPGSEEVLKGNEREIHVKLSRPELAVLEFDVGPSYEGAGPHVHKQHVDSFYVLEGELEVRLGEETVRASPGSFVSVPRCTPSGNPARAVRGF